MMNEIKCRYYDYENEVCTKYWSDCEPSDIPFFGEGSDRYGFDILPCSPKAVCSYEAGRTNHYNRYVEISPEEIAALQEGKILATFDYKRECITYVKMALGKE